MWYRPLVNCFHRFVWIISKCYVSCLHGWNQIYSLHYLFWLVVTTKENSTFLLVFFSNWVLLLKHITQNMYFRATCESCVNPCDSVQSRHTVCSKTGAICYVSYASNSLKRTHQEQDVLTACVSANASFIQKKTVVFTIETQWKLVLKTQLVL